MDRIRQLGGRLGAEETQDPGRHRKASKPISNPTTHENKCESSENIELGRHSLVPAGLDILVVRHEHPDS